MGLPPLGLQGIAPLAETTYAYVIARFASDILLALLTESGISLDRIPPRAPNEP
jgi:hypothetical protein